MVVVESRERDKLEHATERCRLLFELRRSRAYCHASRGLLTLVIWVAYSHHSVRHGA